MLLGRKITVGFNQFEFERNASHDHERVKSQLELKLSNTKKYFIIRSCQV